MSNRERWSIIDDNECEYEVSNRGRIRNVSTKEIEQTYFNKHGFMCILLLLKNKTTFLPLQVHRLVSKHFVENDEPKYKLFVEHIDGDKTNNNAENLKWVYEINKKEVVELNEHEQLKQRSFSLDQKNKMLSIKSKKILDSHQEEQKRQELYEEKKSKLPLKIVIYLSH